MNGCRRVLHASPAQVLFYKLVHVSLICSYYGFHLLLAEISSIDSFFIKIVYYFFPLEVANSGENI